MLPKCSQKGNQGDIIINGTIYRPARHAPEWCRRIRHFLNLEPLNDLRFGPFHQLNRDSEAVLSVGVQLPRLLPLIKYPFLPVADFH